MSSEFDRATLEVLARCHSTDYIQFVNELSVSLEKAEKAGGSSPPLVPFTPAVQKARSKTNFEEAEAEKEKEEEGKKEEGKESDAMKEGDAVSTPFSSPTPKGKHGGGALHSDTSFSSGSLKAARRAAGAVRHAIDRVLLGRNRNAFCVVRPPGHHAGVSGLLEGAESCGFCIFNNVAAGALHALSEHHKNRCGKVAIIDIDIHHGNGTEEIVKNYTEPERLFFFSTHLYDEDEKSDFVFYPGKGGRGAKDGWSEAAAAASNRGTMRSSPLVLPSSTTNNLWLVASLLAGSGEIDDVSRNIINVPIAPQWRHSQVQNAIAKSNPDDESSNIIESSTRGGRRREEGEGKKEKKEKEVEVEFGSGGTAPNSKYPAFYLLGTGRRAYRSAIEKRLIPALMAFNPDLILISSGFDAAKADVGNAKHQGGKERAGCNLRTEDYAWTTKRICEVADVCCGGRVISVLEGGYGRTKVVKKFTRGNPGDEKEQEKPDSKLDRTYFSECAAAHLEALTDPYGREENESDEEEEEEGGWD